MKILKLHFKNLNSLAGEWEIDFTVPAFAGEGLFAITGPTGAGKSTILDALCLALYGQTPRLGKITKNSNEIISRRTGECLAEVTFATRTGTYRCCWHQHRARKKAGGELQNPQHELVEAASGKIIAHKLREVAEQVEELTGLDFERFTRSMLLAQGSFAVFLEAKPDERAPILEEITGTAIYSEISQAVHQRRAAERKEKDRLAAALDNLNPLSPEEEREIEEQLREKNGRAEKLQAEIAALAKAINWRETLEKISADETRLKQ
jgi:exonuclease SbcC